MMRIMKKDVGYFDKFSEMLVMSKKAADALVEMLEDYTNIEDKIKIIDDLEHESDVHVHRIMKELNAAFITPIDREDIYLIAKELDNIVDYIEETAHRFHMYHVQDVKPAAKEFSKIIVESIVTLQTLFCAIVKMKPNDTINKPIIEVNRLENVGDDIYRQELSRLFSEEKDALEVIKWQGIYSYLEKTIDACEDVANIVEGVVMKHA